MRKKSAYSKFIGEKLKLYQGKGGMNQQDAFKTAIADWHKLRASSKPTPEAHRTHFPAFLSVKSELQPILIGVLERLFRSGVSIGFRSISYTLDIGKESEYRAFIDEIIENEQVLRSYFSVADGKLVWNGSDLRFEK
jgi:hypothetical protein